MGDGDGNGEGIARGWSVCNTKSNYFLCNMDAGAG